MANAYWISFYREIIDPAKLARYGRLAGPALEAAGGRFLARAVAAHAYEHGLCERVTLVEFASVEAAVAAHQSPAYQEALAALDNGVVRDFRITAGV